MAVETRGLEYPVGFVHEERMKDGDWEVDMAKVTGTGEV